MAIPGSLLSSILKYRKRRQQIGGPGVPRYAGQCDSAKPVTRVPGGAAISGGSVSGPEVYGGDLPQDYVPHAGFMEIPEHGYEPYDTSLSRIPSMPTAQKIRGPSPDFREKGIDYADCPMTLELFEQLMESAGREVFRSLDQEQMAELQASLELIERGLDLEEIAARLEENHEADRTIPPGTVDAAEPSPVQMDHEAMEPQDFFEQQMQVMENQFSELENMQLDRGPQMDAVFDAQQTLFELSQITGMSPEAVLEAAMGGMSLAGMPGPESLDDVVEAHDPSQQIKAPGYGPDMAAYGGMMTQEVFEQEMHEAAGQMGSAEVADPYDNGAAQPDMYEQPTPDEMMEPEMMDPYMMPGPMGPGFMPEPPPGP